MSKENIIMKTSIFGGFKKADVLSYIETLQNNAADVSDELNRKKREALELRQKIEELEQKVEDLSKMTKLLEEREKQIFELKEKLESANKETAQCRERLFDYQDKSERLARAEKQIGAAYIDARRYSDEIIDKAKAKAKDVGALASQEVKSQANEIEQLLRDVDAVSKKFNSSLEQLHKDVYALSTKLNNSASNLLNIHTELPALDSPSIYNADMNPDEIPEEIRKDMPDAVSVEVTDDGTGLTFISYEPNSEFNEDLNIQPEDLIKEDNNG